MIYEVFARKARGEPLRHIGNLNAPDDALAGIYAYNTYDEEKWFDIWVAPRDRFVEVYNVERGPVAPVDRAPTPAASRGGTSAGATVAS